MPCKRFSDKELQHFYFQQLLIMQQKQRSVEALVDRVRTLNKKKIRLITNTKVNAALCEEGDCHALGVFTRGPSGKVGQHMHLKFPSITVAMVGEYLLKPGIGTDLPESKLFQSDTVC